MAGIQDLETETDLTEEIEDIGSSSGDIAVSSLPRQVMQASLALNPIAKSTSVRIQSKQKNGTATTITETKDSNSITSNSPIESLGLVDSSLNLEDPALSLKERLTKLLKSIRKEWDELRADPITYSKNTLHQLIENSYKYAEYLYGRVTNAYSDFVETIKSYFRRQKSDVALPISDSYEREIKRPIYFRWATSILPYISNSTQNKISVIDTPYSLRQEQDFEYNSEKKKSIFEIFVDALKQFVADLRAKKEHDQKSGLEKDFEEKQRLEREARDRLGKAEELRPDLADEIDLPSTEFIFQSAFNEIPDVATLIEQAQRKKAAKCLD